MTADHSLITVWDIFSFLAFKNNSRDLWSLRHLIRVMRRHEKYILRFFDNFEVNKVNTENGVIGGTQQAWSDPNTKKKFPKVLKKPFFRSIWAHSSPKISKSGTGRPLRKKNAFFVFFWAKKHILRSDLGVFSARFSHFEGTQKWYVGCPNQNSETTFQYKLAPKTTP